MYNDYDIVAFYDSFLPPLPCAVMLERSTDLSRNTQLLFKDGMGLHNAPLLLYLLPYIDVGNLPSDEIGDEIGIAEAGVFYAMGLNEATLQVHRSS